MLSGGGSQADNNYSQFLQARAMAEFFERNYPPDSVWTFFGAGNVAGATPVFSDVYREIKRDGTLIDTWLPGALPRNRPATREEFLPALRREILPAVADGGTLYLFIGDHGSRPDGKNAESLIVLWGMRRDESSEHGWSESDDELLGVTELRRVLASGLGRGRVVFCMTQCYAGGFHYLAVPHEMPADSAWFTTLPAWARSKRPFTSPWAAGFTATDEFSLASGCDPSPDPDQWAGYERYVPECLLGVNLFTHERTGEVLPSFAAAHSAAMLADRTIDKPRSTSEQYLERWAALIEQRLQHDSHLTARLKAAVALYDRTVNGRTPKLADADFQDRQALFHRFVEKLAQDDGAGFLLTGTRAELEQAMRPESAMSAMVESTIRPKRGTRRLWIRTVRPAWKAAVEAGTATGIPAGVIPFEKYLLGQEDRGVDYFFGDGGDLQDDVFWQAGYGDPQTLDAGRAEAIALWAQERDDRILAWAKASGNESLRNAARPLAQYLTDAEANADSMAPEEKIQMTATAAERALFYRRVLAAWEFLINVNDRPALAQLRALTELERTPLPPTK
jgi:hypothetical protein